MKHGRLLIFLFNVLTMPNAWGNAATCSPLPSRYTIDGASFSDILGLGVWTENGFEMQIDSNALDKKIYTESQKLASQREDWMKAHPGTTMMDARMNIPERGTDYQKYLLQGFVRPKVRYINGRLCLAASNNNCLSLPYAVKEDGKSVAQIESSGSDIYVYSVGASGKKDTDKPYVKVSPQLRGEYGLGATISSFSHGILNGTASFPATMVQQNLPPENNPDVPATKLNGKTYSLVDKFDACGPHLESNVSTAATKAVGGMAPLETDDNGAFSAN